MSMQSHGTTNRERGSALARLLPLLLACLAIGSGHAQQREAVKFGPEALAGQKIFQQRCGFCHGATGSGNSAPDLLHSTLVAHDKSGEQIAPVVHGGRPERGMPPFDLSDLEIAQIADFLHTEIKMAATIFYTNSTTAYSLERLLVGNVEAGNAYFNGPGKCATCHATEGDLAHIASRYPPIELQSRLVYPRGAVPIVTVTLPSGQTLTGKQTSSDAFQVSLRDSDGWSHSYDRSKVKAEIKDPLAAHKALLPTYSDKIIHDLFAFLETLK